MGLALVAIIAVSIVGTVLVLRPDSGGGQAGTDNGGSEFASANDTGPANIITEDPTCEAWGKISDQITAVSKSVNWNSQDYSVPAAEWSTEQRAAFEKESAALSDAIPNVSSIAKQTPHRVVRELYGQFNAYAQALVDAVPSYSSADHYTAVASNKFFGVLNRLCDSIHFRAAQQTAPLVASTEPPSNSSSPRDDGAAVPEIFLSRNNGACSDWIAMVQRFDADTKEWRELNPNVRPPEWTPERKAIMDAATPVLVTYADDMERLGRGSGNAIWEDFAVFAAQYLRAYVKGIPTYTPNYVYMSLTSNTLSNAILWACKAQS
ncbi:hypothetical protein [Mycolicibacterium alvei]|uniref:hypothetical protein n=1 Tax=Mycolicibacterium alvei TaxID=67081 RepID=UPI0013D1B98B|nr:hypothetical protein [Mycolicibacterium alvei]MCV6998823.1 hypothetical protein [Mycolicibacterium alvei]